MKKRVSQNKQKNIVYPTESKGNTMAAQLREEANTLTEKQRSELFKRGMQIVYGGSGKKEKVRTRH